MKLDFSLPHKKKNEPKPKRKAKLLLKLTERLGGFELKKRNREKIRLLLAVFKFRIAALIQLFWFFRSKNILKAVSPSPYFL